MKIIGTVRELDETHGAVRVEEDYETDIHDLWEACTKPERLARWIAQVAGDLRVGGDFEACFASGWEGVGRIDACDPPRRLLVSTWEAGRSDEQVIEVTLTPAEDHRTTLVIEERGVPIEQLAEYGAGWQVQVEDLSAHLAGGERCEIKRRWQELISFYRQLVTD
ncbi:MAG: SRPBCC family protein [Brachybacterium sp.]|nr:SRPBCC family protein [Brachybacterium sp.]